MKIHSYLVSLLRVQPLRNDRSLSCLQFTFPISSEPEDTFIISSFSVACTTIEK